MIYIQEGKNKFGAEYRNNTHQEHFEDLVLDGPAGLDELEDKVDNLVKGLDGGDPNLNLSVKIDGCLAPETLVKTTEGDVAIGQIIADNLKGKSYTVYGKDIDGNVIEVEAGIPRVYNGNKDWMTINFENHSSVTCTTDHQFYTQGEWVRAKDLMIGDDIEELKDR